MWMVRYWASYWLLSATLAVMPDTAYRAELRRRIYDLKAEAARQSFRVVGNAE